MANDRSIDVEKVDDANDLPETLNPQRTRMDEDDEEHGIDSGATKEELGIKKTKSIAETLSLPHEVAFVAVICMAQFMTQVGFGQTLAIIHVIGDSFGITDPGVLSWLIAGYSLTIGTFIIFSGRLGDVFGYKKMLLIGFSWFSVWSMVAGLAVYSNLVLFIFARIFQGIGPAIVLPNGLAILGSTYHPGRRKAMVFAIFGAMAPNGSILGSVFAGLFAMTWWPWSFFSFAIALAILVVISFFVIPDPPRSSHTNESLSQKIKSLDILGAVTGVTALVLINFAWNQAPIMGWQETYVYVCLILGFLFVGAFFYIELMVSADPLIPFHALTSDVSFVLGCIACGWSCFGCWAVYFFNEYEVLDGTSPLLTSAYVAPVAVSGAIAAICTGWLLGHVKPAWVMTMAMSAFLTGIVLIATRPIGQIYWAQGFLSAVVAPWGMDMSFPAATLILSNTVQKKHQGIAASLVNTVVNYSISIGLGIAGTVEVHVNNGGKTPEDLLLGYRGAMYVGTGLAGLGLVISLAFVVKSYADERKQGSQKT